MANASYTSTARNLEVHVRPVSGTSDLWSIELSDALTFELFHLGGLTGDQVVQIACACVEALGDGPAAGARQAPCVNPGS